MSAALARRHVKAFERLMWSGDREDEMSKHVTLVLCALVLFLPVPLAAQAIDPQKLVGVWEGTWALRSDRPASGQLTITISKVENGKVYGKTESSGSRENPTATWTANVTETGFGYQGPRGMRSPTRWTARPSEGSPVGVGTWRPS